MLKLDFCLILTKKQPSPETKPANHSPWGIFLFSTLGLETGIIFGNAACNFSDNPKLCDFLIATIFSN